MVIVEKHALELFWLQRRIEFLHKFDQYNSDGEKTDFEETIDEYRSVQSPADIIERMKEIYGVDAQ